MSVKRDVSREPRDKEGRWAKIADAIQISPDVQAVLDSLRAAGGVPLVVGGAVRDAVFGHTVKDVDIETYHLTPAKLVQALSKHGKVDLVGQSFGVYKIRLKNGEDLDVSLPRRENKIGASHQDYEVTADPFMSPKEAASRRDFSINSLAYDPFEQKVHDFHGGMADLDAKVLRHTGPAFAEDALRVLRAMQFAGRFGLKLDQATAELAANLRQEYSHIAKERIWTEWEKLATKAKQPSKGIDVLEQSGWLDFYPELQALTDVPQEPDWHPEGKALIHTKYVADEAARIADRDGLKGEQRAVLVLAAICHDMGKAVPGITVVTEKHGQQRITSHGHAEAGVAPAAKFLDRIGCPVDIKKAVLILVREHMAHTGVSANHRTVSRLAKRLDPLTIREWERIVEADHSGRPPLPRARPARGWVDIAESLGAGKGKIKPLIGGDMLVARGLKPGPSFKRILDAAYEAQMDGSVTAENKNTWLDDYLDKRHLTKGTASSALLLLKGAHDVSQEARDKDGKWTKTPGVGVQEESADEKDKRIAAYMKRYATNPQPGDTVFVGDKDTSDYGDVYVVEDVDKEDVFVRKSYWQPGGARGVANKVWQSFCKDGRLLPRWPDDKAPDPTSTQWELLKNDVSPTSLANFKKQAALKYPPSLEEECLNVLCQKPPKGYSFSLTEASPYFPGGELTKQWTVTRSPAKPGPGSKIYLKGSDGTKQTLTGVQWFKLARSGVLPLDAKRVAGLAPEKCGECGKVLAGATKACPYCGKDFHADCLAKHMTHCSEKATCDYCHKDFPKAEISKCSACGGSFCQDHVDMSDHHCKEGVHCAYHDCGTFSPKKYMTQDPTTKKWYCSYHAYDVLGVTDADSDGKISTQDVVTSSVLARETKDAISRRLSARLVGNEDFAKLSGLVLQKPNASFRYSSDIQDAVDTLINSWAITSCDGNPLAIKLQEAAVKEFGLQDYENTWQGRAIYDNSNVVDFLGKLDQNQPGLRAFLRAMYDNTQEYFSKKGITEVTLYRGFTYNKAGLQDPTGSPAKLPDTSQSGWSNVVSAEAKLQPMSSFSTSADVAAGFTGDSGGEAVTIKLDKVPAEDIIGTALTGFGCLNEQEMVVLGNSIKPCSVSRDGYTFAKKDKDGNEVWLDALKNHKRPGSTDTDDVQKSLRVRTRLPQLSLDKDLHNADWTKRTWDTAAGGSSELKRYLRASGMTIAKFKQLPIFRHELKRRRKQNGR